MPISETSKLASALNKLSSDQDEIKSNLSPDDTESQEQLYLSERLVIGGNVTVNRLEWDTNSLVLDHPNPLWGTLNSSTLIINGGWVTTGGSTFPIAFPIVFTSAGLARTQLDYITF